MKYHRVAGKHGGQAIALAGLVLCCLLVSTATTRAATFEELYTVSVAPDMSLPSGQRQTDAVRRAMAQLLTRITGIRSADQMPELAELIRGADSYRDQYGLIAADEVRISFLRRPIEEALERLNLPLWGDERPSTLLWIAVDFGDGQRAELAAPADGGGRPQNLRTGRASNDLTDAAAESFDELTGELLRAADERGLPIALPRLDAIDRRFVRFADVWGGFDRLVELAAERFDADAVLIGRVSIGDSGPRIRWILRQGGESRTLTDSVPRAGIDWLADSMAAEYTIVGGARFTEIAILDVASGPDFGRVLEYLQSLSIVDDAFVRSLSPDGEIRLRLLVRGDDEELRRVLRLGGVLLDQAGATPLEPVSSPDRFDVIRDDQQVDRNRELVFRPGWLAPAAATENL